MSTIKDHAGEIDSFSMMEMLRSHNMDQSHWDTDRSLTEWTVCVHKGFGPVRASQSVGSLVCRIERSGGSSPGYGHIRAMLEFV